MGVCDQPTTNAREMARLDDVGGEPHHQGSLAILLALLLTDRPTRTGTGGIENKPIYTLTIHRADGALLVAFVAMFVGMALNNFWAILCLAFHQVRSKPSSRSGLHHQQQSVLSNTPAPLDTATALGRLAMTWRGKPEGKLIRSIPLMLTSIIFFGILTAAGIFSSRAMSNGNEVIAKGDGPCGWVGYAIEDIGSPDWIDIGSVNGAWARWSSFRAFEYVRNCYTNTSSSHQQGGLCNVLTTPRISMEKSNVDCPFASELCDADHGAFRVDTGLIDSNSHLGINTPEDSRLRFRKIMTCAPVRVEEGEFSTGWVDEAPSDVRYQALWAGENIPNDTYKYYQLGRRAGQSEDLEYTWMASNFSLRNVDGARRAYSLGALVSLSGFEEDLSMSDFVSIPELRVDNADVSVLYLFNGAMYTRPVDDPWFKASTGRVFAGDDVLLDNQTLYGADQVAPALACTEQYQFCPGSGEDTSNCSPLLGLHANATDPWLGLELNSLQQATFNLVSIAATSITFQKGIAFLGSQLLVANDFLLYGDSRTPSLPVPTSQWKDEVTNFANLMAAVLQRLVVDYGVPPEIFVTTSKGLKSSHEYLVGPRTPGERELCSAMRYRNSNYSNFSVVDLTIILSVGAVVILVNTFCLPGLVFWGRKTLKRNEYATREWESGHLLKLQETALEVQKIGPARSGSMPRELQELREPNTRADGNMGGDQDSDREGNTAWADTDTMVRPRD